MMESLSWIDANYDGGWVGCILKDIEDSFENAHYEQKLTLSSFAIILLFFLRIGTILGWQARCGSL